VSDSARSAGSVYIHWAKTSSSAKFDLATSAPVPYPTADLPFEKGDIEINAPGSYGYEPLTDALAARLGVDPKSLVYAHGTSMANHLAMASLVERGADVLIESPGYEPHVSLAQYLGANVKRFYRRPEAGFAIDVREIDSAVTQNTRLIALTNLHNPSSAFVDNDTLARIGDVARRVGAHVLVDEVYLEAMFDERPPSAYHLGPQFVATGSLTKAYGLSGLRCGWIVAHPRLAESMNRLDDLYGVIPPHAIERLSVIAVKHLDTIAARAKHLMETNRKVFYEFLDRRTDLQSARQKFGTVLFPRLLRGNVDALWTVLLEKYDTKIVPGRFFGAPDHFRIGIGCESETLVEGLNRLGAALDDVGS
jgi:aspartate/methionine/tyrosine aminotransferase